MTNKQIAKVLRWTAQRLYMGERADAAPGLCWAVFRWYGWDAMFVVEETIKPYILKRGRFKHFLCMPYSKWEQRAMFALLLAESLENCNENK